MVNLTKETWEILRVACQGTRTSLRRTWETGRLFRGPQGGLDMESPQENLEGDTGTASSS